LESLAPDAFMSKWMFDRVPHVFGGDIGQYNAWRQALARNLDVAYCELLVIGSAATGRSLSPHKNLSLFSANSDIDVAIVSARYFEEGWRWMRELGATRYQLPSPAQHWVKEHERRLVYWGMIASDQLLPHLPFGPRWLVPMSAAANNDRIENRDINIRIYRDFAALEGSLLYSIKRVRQRLASPYSD
jgi:hypothetical protein